MEKPINLFLVMILFLLSFNLPSMAANDGTLNILSFGTKADGKTDSSQALMKAWTAACDSREPSTIFVPTGSYFVKQAKFLGPCKNKAISFKINGTFVAPSDFKVLGDAGFWFQFHKVDGVSIYGGVLDGQGTSLWSCKRSGKSCPNGATTLRFNHSKNITISGLTSLNSQMFHIVFNGCDNVKLLRVKAFASRNSPNTDGIHVQFSSEFTILKSRIGTGDDCVSIGPGTTNLWIEDMICGPGHGISIGSLGKEFEEEGVKNITVKSVIFERTQTGVRIKSWGRPSKGFAKNVLFQNATMINVQNPIIINQNYCPDSINCPGENSGVQINDVTYQDIHGTSATKVAVKFDCSKKYPCRGIRLEDVKLTGINKPAISSCTNVEGTTHGSIEPASCLYSKKTKAMFGCCIFLIYFTIIK